MNDDAEYDFKAFGVEASDLLRISDRLQESIWGDVYDFVKRGAAISEATKSLEFKMGMSPLSGLGPAADLQRNLDGFRSAVRTIQTSLWEDAVIRSFRGFDFDPFAGGKLVHVFSGVATSYHRALLAIATEIDEWSKYFGIESVAKQRPMIAGYAKTWTNVLACGIAHGFDVVSRIEFGEIRCSHCSLEDGPAVFRRFLADWETMNQGMTLELTRALKQVGIDFPGSWMDTPKNKPSLNLRCSKEFESKANGFLDRLVSECRRHKKTVIGRDVTFLLWRWQDSSDSEIRDRWNSLESQRRQQISRRGCKAISCGETGRVLVKSAIKRLEDKLGVDFDDLAAGDQETLKGIVQWAVDQFHNLET